MLSKRTAFTIALLIATHFAFTTQGQARPGIPVAQPSKTSPAISLVAPISGMPVAQDGVPRWMCFSVEQLPAAQRAEAEALLLKACDEEALYTIVGGVKPMSSGWLHLSLEQDDETKVGAGAARIDAMRQVVAHLRCGDEITAHIAHFARRFDGKVSLQGVLFNRPALRQELENRPDFWQKWALTKRTEPLEVLMSVEYATSSDRFRGYGYLFGYPQHAVDFFAESSLVQQKDPDKKLVPRDLLHIPTFRGDTNRFVYAVPKGHVVTPVDIALRERCAPILKEYKRRRALYIGPGKPGIARLLRDWFDNGNGRCSPRFARY